MIHIRIRQVFGYIKLDFVLFVSFQDGAV